MSENIGKLGRRIADELEVFPLPEIVQGLTVILRLGELTAPARFALLFNCNFLDFVRGLKVVDGIKRYKLSGLQLSKLIITTLHFSVLAFDQLGRGEADRQNAPRHVHVLVMLSVLGWYESTFGLAEDQLGKVDGVGVLLVDFEGLVAVFDGGVDLVVRDDATPPDQHKIHAKSGNRLLLHSGELRDKVIYKNGSVLPCCVSLTVVACMPLALGILEHLLQ